VVVSICIAAILRLVPVMKAAPAKNQ
jgi:hypothetical protein